MPSPDRAGRPLRLALFLPAAAACLSGAQAGEGELPKILADRATIAANPLPDFS
ncbi:MAG: hypothetical protein IBJ13_01110 [Sphingopyxis sp.]|nr:hypothetical protein [Sphingopyxis sp.]